MKGVALDEFINNVLIPYYRSFNYYKKVMTKASREYKACLNPLLQVIQLLQGVALDEFINKAFRS